METTTVLGLYRVYIGIMEKKMETAIVLGIYRDKGKENGNYYHV